jgi:hypothetical protein
MTSSATPRSASIVPQRMRGAAILAHPARGGCLATMSPTAPAEPLGDRGHPGAQADEQRPWRPSAGRCGVYREFVPKTGLRPELASQRLSLVQAARERR